MSTFHFEVTGVYFLNRYELDFEVSISEFIDWSKKFWKNADFGILEDVKMDGTPIYHSDGDCVGIYTKSVCTIEANFYQEALDEINNSDFGELCEIESYLTDVED